MKIALNLEAENIPTCRTVVGNGQNVTYILAANLLLLTVRVCVCIADGQTNSCKLCVNIQPRKNIHTFEKACLKLSIVY